MRADYDIVIVGAGPAGSAAAFTACQRGLTVALVDKAVFPRAKLCGGLVSGRGLKALDAIFGERPAEELFLIGREVAWLWKGEELARFRVPYPLWFTGRFDLDHDLHQRALAAGAADYSGRRWQALDSAANEITLDGGEVLRYGALIAADGATSPIAAELFGRAFDPGKIGFTLEAECARRTRDHGLMAVDFRAVPWGYGWLFPKNNSLTVGVGGLHSENPDLRPALAALMPEGQAGVKVKGAFLPLGDFRKEPARGNILFAGDAAGLVDPLTGEGIAYALESGALAAGAIAGALEAGAPERAGQDYLRRLAPIHRDLTQALRLRKFAYSRVFEGVFRKKLQNSHWIRTAFFDLLEGETTYDALERDVMARLKAQGLLGKLGASMVSWPRRA